MAITTRQSGLLVAEDWTKLYQTFRNADFQSYDYETLRKSMVEYLRLYYPEDFNDFIESSEFVALLDLIAFLGQSLAFRADLNARENYIDTAQRRDSVLKLARLISYTPKRNIPASGFLKVDSISTTEVIYDSNGLNLSGLVIEWNDVTNDNWSEQFTAIVNATLVTNQMISKPSNRQTIQGVITEEYQMNLNPSLALPTFAIKASVEGTPTSFEIVSPTSANHSYIYEDSPRPNGLFNLLYRNDNQGNSSNDTGFFLYFKQGELKSIDVNFQESIANRVYGINTNNINNTDVWVYSINSNGALGTLWQQVPAVGVTNVIYNKSINKDVYQINSRSNDQIDLIFGDGSFANIPQGRFRIYYRVSNGLQYKITPNEISGAIIPINYLSRSGRIETLNIRASLRYTVANSSPRETLDEVRQKAPQQYFTQDRMVTGEDYNILPYTLFNTVLKVKAVNRTVSGISRYLDVVDTTGKYSSTNIFAADGILYRDSQIQTFTFDFDNRNNIVSVINNRILPVIDSPEIRHFFYAHYPRPTVGECRWSESSDLTNGSTGFFYRNNTDYAAPGEILQIGSYVSDTRRFIRPGAILRFSAEPGTYFNNLNQIQSGAPRSAQDRFHIYAQVVQVVADGTNSGQGSFTDGTGPVTLNQRVPAGITISKIFSTFNTQIDNQLVTTMTNYFLNYVSFGLRYDQASSSWQIILPENLDSNSEFSLTRTGDTTGQRRDSSWLLMFQAQNQIYTVHHRLLNYVFQSVRETDFYYDEHTKIFDSKNGQVVDDHIKILKVNSQSDSANPLQLDYVWNIYRNVTEADGYTNPDQVLVTYPDGNADGIPDNPEIFETLVNPDVNMHHKLVYFRNVQSYNNFIRQEPVQELVIADYDTLQTANLNIARHAPGQLLYIPSDNQFYQLVISTTGGTEWTPITGYTARTGRADLYFQYRHNSPNNRRIDPSPSNIIDIYILTKQYAADYLAWIQDNTHQLTEPVAPSSETLRTQYSLLENYKMVSNSLIYNTVKFKPIFGAKAATELQATFKVVKNPNIIVSDNDIKSSVIAAINDYFNLDNWDFGETFYFSELSAYLHQTLAPNIASIIIVPVSSASPFGSLMQINVDYNEIVVSSATVDNVQIISSITAAQIGQI
jgi:hypothetical protein